MDSRGSIRAMAKVQDDIWLVSRRSGRCQWRLRADNAGADGRTGSAWIGRMGV